MGLYDFFKAKKTDSINQNSPDLALLKENILKKLTDYIQSRVNLDLRDFPDNNSVPITDSWAYVLENVKTGDIHRALSANTSIEIGDYDLHVSFCLSTYLFRNPTLTANRVALAFELAQAINGLHAEDPKFVEELENNLTNFSQRNQALNPEAMNSIPRTVNRFFCQGSFFQSNLGNIIDKACHYLAEIMYPTSKTPRI